MKYTGQTFSAILFFLIISFNYSCTDDLGKGNTPLPQFIQVGEATRSYENVDERLWVYFERFENAATERGITFSLEANNVTGSIENNPGHNSAGGCTTNNTESIHHVSIRSDFWQTSSNTEREILIFHELGHCYLERSHQNASDDEGVCISLMRAGGNFCMDNYFRGTRDYYLDELFEVQ